jgi:hypothetical protein
MLINHNTMKRISFTLNCIWIWMWLHSSLKKPQSTLVRPHNTCTSQRRKQSDVGVPKVLHVIHQDWHTRQKKYIWLLPTHGQVACSFGLSATSQQYFSLRTNQTPAISQQYFSLRTNQHPPSATSQTNRLKQVIDGEDSS